MNHNESGMAKSQIYSDTQEKAGQIIALGRVGRAGEIISDVLLTAEKRSELPEVISGHGCGYIRSSPELVHSMLAQSVEQARVISDDKLQVTGAVKCVIDLIVHHGVTIAESQHRRHGIIEAYEATVNIKSQNDTFDDLTIIARGPLHASQLAKNATLFATPVGELLPEPKFDITFTKYDKNGQSVVHRFIFARDGHARFERAIDDTSGYRIESLDSAAAFDYLKQHLPIVEQCNAQPTLSQGRAQIYEHTLSTSFNTIRRNRLAYNGDDLQQIVQAKLGAFGYDTVHFVPATYFESNSRDGEFFSMDVPEALIPVDVLEHPDSKSRVAHIAAQLQVAINETTVNDAMRIAEGLPGGWSKIAILAQSNYDVPCPRIIRRPTKVYDKSLTYMLERPDLIADVMVAHRAMTKLFGEPVTVTYLQVALEAGLLGRNRIGACEVFEDFVQRSGPKIKSPSSEDALDRTFAALSDLGNRLREVYSQEELLHYAQYNPLLAL